MNELGSRYNPKVRLNSICPYFTMFPLEFPFKALQKAMKHEWILDPFCGRGTTNYAARLLGLRSVGIDSNPVASSIAQVKLLKTSPKRVSNLIQEILINGKAFDIPTGEFWELAYNAKTLTEIIKIRNYFIQKSNLSNTDIALRAIMLGILHGPRLITTVSYLSNQMPRTFSTKPDYYVKYWKKHKLYPIYTNTAELVKRKAEYFFNPLLPQSVEGRIINGDSRKKISFHKKFNWVITSPPYYGMFSYEQDQWLRNWFLGGDAEVNYNQEQQLKHHSETVFVNDLAEVWRRTAEICNPNAKLIIRFGAIPSKAEKPPSLLLKESIIKAGCGWKISTIKTAGKPLESNRQSNQFRRSKNGYIEEIDVYAKLDI